MICWNTELLKKRTEALFIGGTADGERRTLTERPSHLHMPVRVPGPPYTRAMAQGRVPIPELRFRQETYRSIDLYADREHVVTLYAYLELDDKQVLLKLVENYNPVTDPNGAREKEASR